jgi:hypothetical protein
LRLKNWRYNQLLCSELVRVNVPGRHFFIWASADNHSIMPATPQAVKPEQPSTPHQMGDLLRQMLSNPPKPALKSSVKPPK